MKNTFTLSIAIVMLFACLISLKIQIENQKTWLQQLSVNYNYTDAALQALMKENNICHFEDNSFGKCYPDAPTFN